ncbi:glycoside hydrolase family 13 protein [Herbiconiux moechotypicola]|uniref:Glycoside hydrolase family 13 protein n=1 Tax=Herbiconiux moechotypicola TaxID=637393 RepID=A0ABP5Q7P3_9MICO|nr:glycoside hydrolase family 13 protein [Herbiconiux moechotypicola]MCS5728769.1 glycoside hydrolase family 13 protein [Herbiconiux moechotypicola]
MNTTTTGTDTASATGGLAASTATTAPPAPTPPAPWWRDAVVYQIYVRSYRDSSGDGIGDLAGIRDGLDDIARLGVDAVWLNPCYVSPQRDHGYDISDYFDIDPAYGTVADLEQLVEAAHERGIRVLMDLVANHCSLEHAWFQDALAASPGSAERERFLFRDGRGPGGDTPPNNWQSVFGGPAWTRVVEGDGRPGQWYFHAFDSGQPDFNWRNPEVADYFDRVLDFWFARGVDGFRIDVAHGHVKSAELADWPGADDGTGGHNYAMWDQPEVHEIYRSWRALGERHPEPKYFVGEIWVPSIESLGAYLRPDELHQAFNFDLLVQPWHAERMRAAVTAGLAQGTATGGAPAWALANHDVHRATTRYGQEQHLGAPDPTDMISAARRTGAVDVELGMRRARAAAFLLLALPGTAYLYQGEELGLPEVLDLPPDARQDPIWLRSGGEEIGRDGCRVPLPWQAGAANFGFTPEGSDASPWLPQPGWFDAFAVDRQRSDPASTLSLTEELLRLRRSLFSTTATPALEWLEHPDPHVLAFRRGDGVCVVNFGDAAVTVPADWAVRPVLHSAPPIPAATHSGPHDPGPGEAYLVEPDSAAWFARHPTAADAEATAGAHHGVDDDSHPSPHHPAGA